MLVRRDVVGIHLSYKPKGDHSHYYQHDLMRKGVVGSGLQAEMMS